MDSKHKTPDREKRILAIQGFFDAFNNNILVIAIRRGLILMIPFMIIGALAVLVNNLPIDAYQNAMLSLFGENWKNFGAYIWQATYGIMSISLNLSIGYALSEGRKDKSVDIHPMINALVSLACLFTLINVNGNIADWIGALGVFIAIVTAFIASKIHIRLCEFRYFKIKLFSNAAESHFNMAILSLVPAACTIAFFGLIRVVLFALGIHDIHVLIYETLHNLFSNLSSAFSTGIIFVTLTHVFWFFGLHGNNILEPVAQSVLTPALETNIALAEQGLPPTEIFTKQFFDAFVFLGGSGTTLCLIIALFLAARRSNTRKVAAISIFPGLINVNEVMIFGVPIVLNFYFLIPFVLVPTILTFISYTAMRFGLVPLTIAAAEWTTPILIGGYIVTGGSIAGSILQCFNLIVGTFIYLPFVRMHEKSLERDNKRILKSLMTNVLNLQELQQTVLLNRKDDEGNMARSLVSDLTHSLRNEHLMLHYQPLIMEDDTVFGVEALLRWKHEQLGFIPPPIIIAVAEESGLIHELGAWIFKTALKALKEFKDNGMDSVIISINITPSQLDNPSLVEDVMAIAQKNGIDPHHVDIEITEQTALGGIARMQTIKKFKELGFNIAMDDFGMGHSSLMYLKDMNLDVIKIDGSLIKEIESNPYCRDIISTIVNLCRSMSIHIIAEYVENENQKTLLSKLGCSCYQGYLYSPALPFDKAMEFMLNQEKKRRCDKQF